MKVAIIYNKDITGVLNKLGMQNKEFYSEESVKLVARYLERAGHNVSILDGNMYIIDRLKTFMPHTIDGEQMGMVFNMAYGIQGESRYTHIPSMLEMLGVPYVGSNPSGHAVALDKVMTKIVWQNSGLPTPVFHVFSSHKEDMSTVVYPVIVKPKMESVSFGLKVVDNERDLREAVKYVIEEYQQQALVEQFIRGREFCIGLLGNNPIEAFPVLEIDLKGDPDAIQTITNKKQQPMRKICPAPISDDLAGEMVKLSKQAFRSLELRDFARVDIRLDEDNNIYLLEINSMASLGKTGSYSAAAAVAGYDFERLVNKMLDVAAVRYFSNMYPTVSNEKPNVKLSLHSRLRSFLRSRQQNMEKLLEKIVNMDTHSRNIEGINYALNLIHTELTHLGFTGEIFPQLEVGNMAYYANTFEEQLDYLLLLSIDDKLKMQEQESFQTTEHKLFGTGIWENKGGVVTAMAALQALRFAKLLRKVKIGVFVITDSNIGGKFSKDLVKQKSVNAANIIGMHGGSMEGGIVTSRSGSANYSFGLKLINPESAENVNLAAYQFFKTNTAIIDLGKKDKENVVAPYGVEFYSNIFKKSAYGNAKISVRFNTMTDFRRIDEKIRSVVNASKKNKGITKIQFDGGLSRPPMQEDDLNISLFNRVKEISRRIDTLVVAQHRWSSSDICVIVQRIPKIDGMGPLGGFDKNKSEYILRHSIVDRALLLALLLEK